MRGLQVYPENMRRNLEVSRGLVFSQSTLLALIDKGLSRKKAYELVQQNALKAWNGREEFLSLLKNDPEINSRLSLQELEAIFDHRNFLKHVDGIFKRLGLTER